MSRWRATGGNSSEHGDCPKKAWKLSEGSGTVREGSENQTERFWQRTAANICLLQTQSKTWQLSRAVYGILRDQPKRLQLNREAHAIYLQALDPELPKTQGIVPFIQNFGPAAAHPYCGPYSGQGWRGAR